MLKGLVLLAIAAGLLYLTIRGRTPALYTELEDGSRLYLTATLGFSSQAADAGTFIVGRDTRASRYNFITLKSTGHNLMYSAQHGFFLTAGEGYDFEISKSGKGVIKHCCSQNWLSADPQSGRLQWAPTASAATVWQFNK